MYALGLLLFQLFHRPCDASALEAARRRILPPSLLMAHPSVAATILYLLSEPSLRPTASQLRANCPLVADMDLQVVVPKTQLEHLDLRIQKQKDTIKEQEDIIKEQEKKIIALSARVKRKPS